MVPNCPVGAVDEFFQELRSSRSDGLSKPDPNEPWNSSGPTSLSEVRSILDIENSYRRASSQGRSFFKSDVKSNSAQFSCSARTLTPGNGNPPCWNSDTRNMSTHSCLPIRYNNLNSQTESEPQEKFVGVRFPSARPHMDNSILYSKRPAQWQSRYVERSFWWSDIVQEFGPLFKSTFRRPELFGAPNWESLSSWQ